MSTPRHHSSTHHTRTLRELGLTAVILISVGLSACTSVQPPTAAPTAATAATADATPMPMDGDLEPGTYVVTGFAVPFEVTVPDGWRILGGWRLIRETPDEEHAAFLTFMYPLEPAFLPADACQWSPPIPEVEQTVEGFADALAAQESTTTTTPDEVMVGDYRALEFDYAVDSGIESIDCRAGHICVYAETSGDCSRWYTGTTERETYRVVDLSGDRAVLSVGQYHEDVDPAVMQEARAVFDSIVFKPGE